MPPAGGRWVSSGASTLRHFQKPCCQRGDHARVNCARGTATIGPCVPRSTHCMCGAARPNCHTLTLSDLEPCRAPTESMPAAARSHCIHCLRDLKMLAFVCGLRRWSTNFGRLFVVYLRIAHISRLNLAGTLPGPCRMSHMSRILSRCLNGVAQENADGCRGGIHRRGR
jgi:hypothetical protein